MSPAHALHGRRAFCSFHGQAHATKALEARPYDEGSGADDAGPGHRPSPSLLKAAVGPTIDRVVAIVPQHEIGTQRNIVHGAVIIPAHRHVLLNCISASIRQALLDAPPFEP